MNRRKLTTRRPPQWWRLAQRQRNARSAQCAHIHCARRLDWGAVTIALSRTAAQYICHIVLRLAGSCRSASRQRIAGWGATAHAHDAATAALEGYRPRAGIDLVGGSRRGIESALSPGCWAPLAAGALSSCWGGFFAVLRWWNHPSASALAARRHHAAAYRLPAGRRGPVCPLAPRNGQPGPRPPARLGCWVGHARAGALGAVCPLAPRNGQPAPSPPARGWGSQVRGSAALSLSLRSAPPPVVLTTGAGQGSFERRCHAAFILALVRKRGRFPTWQR